MLEKGLFHRADRVEKRKDREKKKKKKEIEEKEKKKEEEKEKESATEVSIFELRHQKTCLVVSNEVRHKLCCATTEDG